MTGTSDRSADPAMRFDHRLEAVTEARHWVRERLGRLAPALDGTRREETLLMASELVTNVVAHTRSRPEVRIRRDGNSVRIEVSDDDPALPVVRPLDPTRVGGNGLRIVDRWADRWGVASRPGDGKVVWFAVDAGPPPVARPERRPAARPRSHA